MEPTPSTPHNELVSSDPPVASRKSASGLYRVAAAAEERDAAPPSVERPSAARVSAPRRGVDEAAAVAERLHFLSGALRAFAEATTDYDRLLAIVATTMAGGVQDGCVLCMLTPCGELEPVASSLSLASSHSAESQGRIRARLLAIRSMLDRPTAQRLLDTGEPVLFAPWRLQALAMPGVAELQEVLGIHSLLGVALRLHGRSIGACLLFRCADTSQAFGAPDLEMAQALADHAALAISNATLLRSAVEELARRKGAERTAALAVEQVRQADRLATVGKLFAEVAHELGSPLNVIGGTAQLIAAGELGPDEVVTGAQTIVGQVARATAIVRPLLDFARRKAEGEIADVDALAVARDVAGLLTSFARKRGVSLSATGSSVQARAGEGCMAQVFTNLLMNAIHASSSGSNVAISIHRVIARKPGGTTAQAFARADVHDTGTGMTAAIRARIFEPFFTTKARGEGTGLGLSVARDIVQERGGWLEVQTLPAGGSTFSVFLPMALASDPLPTCAVCGASNDRTPCDEVAGQRA